MPTLRAQLDALAASFANQIMASLRGASLHDLVGKADGGRVVSNGRRARGGGGQPDPRVVPTKPRKPGRLPRRSAEEIAATLNKIVLLVKTQKNGMRAEIFCSKLGMQAKEMPRILKEGLSKKKLTSKGNKRATTYFAR